VPPACLPDARRLHAQPSRRRHHPGHPPAQRLWIRSTELLTARSAQQSPLFRPSSGYRPHDERAWT
jgi:hypothetical protein